MTGDPLDDPPPGIRARGLNLWYGAFQALKDVNVDIEQGAITAIIGASGCGKTSLLRSINRLNERVGAVRTTGELAVFGHNVYAAGVDLGELRKTVGMVFQRPNPLPISIYENVVFGLRVHAAARAMSRRALDEEVESALRSVLLWDDVRDDLRRNATRLSPEQQQKLQNAALTCPVHKSLHPDVQTPVAFKFGK